MSSNQPYEPSDLLNVYDNHPTKAAKLYNFVSLTTKHAIVEFSYEYVDAMKEVGIQSNIAKSLPQQK